MGLGLGLGLGSGLGLGLGLRLRLGFGFGLGLAFCGAKYSGGSSHSCPSRSRCSLPTAPEYWKVVCTCTSGLGLGFGLGVGLGLGCAPARALCGRCMRAVHILRAVHVPCGARGARAGAVACGA